MIFDRSALKGFPKTKRLKQQILFEYDCLVQDFSKVIGNIVF